MAEQLDNHWLQKNIKQVFDDANKLKIKGVSTKEPYIRPSMAPGCALKMFVEICNGLNDGWETEENFMMAYYTSIGTLTHEIFQRWFGLTGKLIGNWSCGCKGTKKEKILLGRTVYEIDVPKVYIKNIVSQQICTHCKKPMKYEEIGIDVKGIVGHIDGILEFTVNNKKYHIVIDYKGTNADKLKRDKDNPRFPQYPDPKHIKQITLYSYALKKYYSEDHGLNIVGYAILYTSRDTPIPKYKIVPKIMDELDWDIASELFKSQIKQVRILNKCLTDGNLERLIKHRLCPDMDYYKCKVHHKYSECAYSAICFSAPKQLMSLLKEAKKKLKQKKGGY
jgi:hypothetical protein